MENSQTELLIAKLWSELDEATRDDILTRAIDAAKTRVKSDYPTDVGALETKYGGFAETHTFSAGQLVRWKHGLRNKRLPLDNQPAVVVELLKEPVVNQEVGPGSPYFREPLDIVLGVLDEDGDFLLFHHDSRRFMPF